MPSICQRSLFIERKRERIYTLVSFQMKLKIQDANVRASGTLAVDVCGVFGVDVVVHADTALDARDG